MTEKIHSTAGYFLAGLAIGSLVAIVFAPKSGEGTRDFLAKKLKEGSKHARKKARELRHRADDWPIAARSWSTRPWNKLPPHRTSPINPLPPRNRKPKPSSTGMVAQAILPVRLRLS